MYDNNKPFGDNHDYNIGSGNQFFMRNDDETNNAFAQNAEELQFKQNAGIHEF